MSERMLLTNGRVLTCSGDPSESPSDAQILVEGDRIARVAPTIDVDPASTRIVDLRGATVLPGLADCHVHISWPLDFVFDHVSVAKAPAGPHMIDVASVVRTFLESGYTLIIGAGTTQADDDLIADDSIRRGLIPGPRLIPSAEMVTEPGGISADTGLTKVCADARELREEVKRQCDRGVKAIKFFVSGDGVIPEYPSEDVYMNDEMLEAAVDEADKHGAFITVHARSAPSIAMSARTGVRVIHHACFIDDEAMSELEKRRDDVWVCPALHYLYAMVKGHAEPWGMTPERIERTGYARELEASTEGLRKLHAAGVKIVSGGDFGHQWTHHGTYAAELERYVELLDMVPIEAIHTATRNVGPLARLDTGEIRDGYLADLLVVDGDPTADIAVLQRPELRRMVIKGGEFAYINPGLYP